MSNHNAIYRYAEKVKLTRVEAVKKAIREGGSVPEAARIIGVHRASLYDFIKNHNIVETVTRKHVIGAGAKDGAA